MNEILDSLYEIAADPSPYWLFDDEEARAYRNGQPRLNLMTEQLRERLTAADFAFFDKYMEARTEQDHYERRMLFTHALSIGLSLGTLYR